MLLAACAPAAVEPQATPTLRVLEVKQLATVFISPTPDATEAAATRAAIIPTATTPPPPPTVTPTMYVGVFLGEADLGDFGPAINPAEVANPPTPNIPATRTATCQIPPNPVFGVAWSVDGRVSTRLGCPIQVMAASSGASQVFERGVMYWREDTDETWAIAPAAGRFWFVQGAPEESNADVAPPPGLRVPVRDFGFLWRSYPDVRTALGYAQTEAARLDMTSQRFDSGLLLRDGETGVVFALIIDGTAFGPF
jgi:hypothetical protein